MHVKSQHLKQRFPCPVDGCTFTSSRQNYIHGHIRSAHSQAAFTCPIKGCAFRSAYRRDISRHRRAKHENKLVSCSYVDCSFATSRPDSLSRHMKTRHSMQRRLACCHVCGEKIDEQLLIKHLQTHAQEDGHPFEDCPSCQEEMDKGSTVHPDLDLLLKNS